MTKPVQFNPRTLRKPSQILRKAAEVIKHELETEPRVDPLSWEPWNQNASLGGCAALDDVQDFTIAKLDPDFHYIEPIRVVNFNDNVERARDLFRETHGYHNKGRRKTGYWFGRKFTEAEQQHRIDALLLTAEIAEAAGE